MDDIQDKKIDEDKLVSKLTEKVGKKTAPILKFKYRLNVYSPAGTIRHSIPIAILQDMGKKHGDIMRAISSIRWMTLDEICSETWRLETKMKNPSNRSRKNIEDSVNELIERSLVVTRPL